MVPTDIMYTETIRSFLERPFPIATGDWSTASQRGTVIASGNPLNEYLGANLAIAGKLAGFALLRTEMELTIRLNGTRFHFGALVLAYYPLDSLVSQQSRYNPYSATMQPSSIVTPFADNVDPIICPWLYPYHFLNLTATGQTTSFGNYQLTVLAPLGLVGQTTTSTVPYTIYARCLNPTLTGFTSGTQSSTFQDDPIVLQSLVSGSAQRLVAENFNAYRTFGNDTSIEASVTNVHVPTSIEEHGFDGSDMTYTNMLKTRSFYALIPWSTSDLQGTRLHSQAARPQHGITVAGSTLRNYLGTVMDAHRFWRGSLGFHIKIFASGFHTGRLAISWDPVIQSMTTTNPNINNTNRIILDLQQETEIYFKVPYAFFKPWATQLEYLPSLAFSVQNPLKVASGTSSLIWFGIWAYGLDSIKFALPYSKIIHPLAAPPASDDDPIELQCYKATEGMFKSISGARDMFPKASMPEECVSVLETCRRLAPIVELSVRIRTGTRVETINPWYISSGAKNPFQLFMSCFAVSRGSIRYAANLENVSYASTVTPSPVDKDYSASIMMSANINSFQFDQNTQDYSLARFIHDSAPSSMMVIPFYTQAKFVVHRRRLTTTDLYPFYGLSRPPGVGDADYSIYASPGLDFKFGMLLAPLLETILAVGN